MLLVRLPPRIYNHNHGCSLNNLDTSSSRRPSTVHSPPNRDDRIYRPGCSRLADSSHRMTGPWRWMGKSTRSLIPNLSIGGDHKNLGRNTKCSTNAIYQQLADGRMKPSMGSGPTASTNVTNAPSAHQRRPFAGSYPLSRRCR